MVVEDVVIRVEERGAKAAARGIKQVGTSSRKAKIAVAGLVTALVGFVSIRGIARIGADAIRTAASFEQMGIQIAALLGSQKEANVALDNFTKLAAKTPFSVKDIVGGATALGAAALGNREKLEQLTQTTANLAAVTGISFEQAASNLQRALTSGIASADLFRDKGVKALIESIAGIPDATKLSNAEFEKLINETFGAGGVFGDAAENLSATLGGALSNIGDASTNASAALGKAFSPAVIAAARQAIIPFLEKLQSLIVENEEEIKDFAAGALKAVISAFVFLTRAGLALLAGFSESKVKLLELSGTYDRLTLSVSQALLKALEFANLISGGRLDSAVNIARGAVKSLTTEVDDYASEVDAARAKSEKFVRGLDSINDALAGLERASEAADFGKEEKAPTLDVKLPTGPKAEVEDPKAATAREAAAKRLLSLTNQLRISAAGRVSQFDAQLERLDQQAIKLREQAEIAGDAKLAAEGLALIDAQRLSIEQERAALLKEEAAEAAKERSAEAAALGAKVSEAISTGGQSVIDDLAGFTQSKMEEAMGEAMLAAEDVIGEVFSSAFEGVDFGGIFGDSAGALGSAFGAALGFGAGLLAKELGGSSASSRNDLVQSATESSQATRGVVAGPSSVPIFQFGQKIEEAMGGTEDLLARILDAILSQPVGSAGAPVGTDSASADLSSRTPSLA